MVVTLLEKEDVLLLLSQVLPVLRNRLLEICVEQII